MGEHYRTVCQFGRQHSTCRCTARDKAVRRIECPTPARCSQSVEVLMEQKSSQAVSALTEAVLIAHQRTRTGDCMCGWAEWGHSHAAHVRERLQAEGVLRET